MTVGTVEGPVERLRAQMRMIISHASGGHLSEPDDIDRSTNDICVEISRHHNRVWEHAKEERAAEVLSLQSQLVAKDEALTELHDAVTNSLGVIDPERRLGKALLRAALTIGVGD